MTLILPHAQGVASERRAAAAGMMIKRRRGGVLFAPLDARLARGPLAAIYAVKVSR